MYDIIIIGAGPAGLTAAIYGKRANKKVKVLEKKSYGGQIINTLDIENYPVENHISGFDFATKLYNQAKEIGAEIAFEEVKEVTNKGHYREVVTNNNSYETKTVIIATGQESRNLDLANEKELLGKGVSYCATCDGAFFKNQDVAVVGGGNTALEDALYLSNLASKVYLIHRRDEFRADAITIDKIKSKSNIECIYNSTITKINGKDKLESVEVSSDGLAINIPVTGLFIAIGRVPNTSIFSDIELDEHGYIKSDENCHTNIDGIFVAGDNRTKDLRQLVTATSDGAIAANEAIKYIERN